MRSMFIERTVYSSRAEIGYFVITKDHLLTMLIVKKEVCNLLLFVAQSNKINIINSNVSKVIRTFV